MKYHNIILVAAIVFLAVSSCKSQFDILLMSNDVDAKYEAAFNYFELGKYKKAADLFESMAILTSGTDRDDTVQYYWGLSNYNYKDFYTAESNFAKFIETFPRSPFAENARYLRIDCLYRATLRYELDQTPTYTAMNTINEYMRDYPSSEHNSDCVAMMADLNERLDRKAFENARLYYKMEDYKASRVAFKNVLKDDSDNMFREDIMYYIAMSSYKFAHLSVAAKQRERYLTFVDDYYNFVGEIPESPYRKELDVLYRRAQRALGNFIGENEGEDKLRDRDFIKERRVRKRVSAAAAGETVADE